MPPGRLCATASMVTFGMRLGWALVGAVATAGMVVAVRAAAGRGGNIGSQDV